MVTEVSDMNLSHDLGKLLSQVEDGNESILINKNGKPIAALVDAELFVRINRMRDRFDDLTKRLAENYAETPAEVGLAEIDAAMAAERAWI